MDVCAYTFLSAGVYKLQVTNVFLKYENVTLSVILSVAAVKSKPSYLKDISSPAPSTSAPFHLCFVHHRPALFQADLVQDVVGLQRETEESFSWMGMSNTSQTLTAVSLRFSPSRSIYLLLRLPVTLTE